ncbi:MAG TPA: glycosyltransferase [Patescibacteria group bacterium]
MQQTTALTKSAITFSLIKNRHVGQFTEGYPLTNGVTVAVDTLVQNLPSNFKSTIVAPEAGNQNDPADVLRIPAIGELWEYPIAQPWRTKHLVHYFANNGLDLVHVHHPFLMGMVGAKIAKKFKVPLVAHHHTLYETYGHYVKLPTSISDRIAKYGLGPWLHWYYDIFAECATIIVPSKATETSLRQMGVEASIRVIPTGVPLPKSEDISPAKQQEIRCRYGIKSEDFLLLYVGRLAKEKNLDLALQAFDALANEHTNLHFLFVGSGPEEESLREQAALSVAADRIHFAGRQPRELLDPFYAAGDLFVFPSTTETQGLVTAEAQVAGTPSVVVNVGGACELVTDGMDGLVTAPTVADLSQSIRSILTNPTLHATLKQGCITNRSKRTPAAMIEQVLDVYESVLAR